MLIRDHRDLDDLFARHHDGEPGTQQAIIDHLHRHTTIEHDHFYPHVAALVIKGGRDMVEAAEEQHREIQELVQQFSADSGMGERLRNLVAEHVAFEEGEMFPALEAVLTDDRLHRLGWQIERSQA